MSRRRGFTLVELVLAVTIASITAALAARALARGQRFQRDLQAVVSTRRALRDGATVLGTDLRGLVTADTLALATDTAVEMRTALGASMLCAPAPAGTTVLSLPPDSTAGGITLTSWLTLPESGDDILVYHDVSPSRPAAWTRSTIVDVTAAAASANCAADWPVTGALGATSGARSWRLSLASPLTDSAGAGAPVRLVRRGRYDVYRAADQRWYLGYRRCGSAGCAGVQPVSGPYGDAARPPVRLRYFRRDQSSITGLDVSGIARIEIGVASAWHRSAAAADSLVITVAGRGAP